MKEINLSISPEWAFTNLCFKSINSCHIWKEKEESKVSNQYDEFDTLLHGLVLFTTLKNGWSVKHDTKSCTTFWHSSYVSCPYKHVHCRRSTLFLSADVALAFYTPSLQEVLLAQCASLGPTQAQVVILKNYGLYSIFVFFWFMSINK